MVSVAEDTVYYRQRAQKHLPNTNLMMLPPWRLVIKVPGGIMQPLKGRTQLIVIPKMPVNHNSDQHSKVNRGMQ